ncbi:MAG: flagellar motor protein MotB [Deltaproteobacteria bacterium]|jgi:chemotaxis protein MotB|nr:flagellar motor protein MotB [Deltaproteobacteria bacterium]MBT4526835.1 flagellar motor protein MotB [Deltaproteobacteria bacterium]
MAIEEECECNCGEERVEWIYTYGDMVTLLLCFFVLLFAMSKTNEEKFKAVAASFKGGPPASPFVFTGMPTFMESMESSLKKSDIAEVMDITVDDQGITVSFSDTAMFDPGSANPTEEGKDIIEKFARILYAVPNGVIIEGHTDDQKISNETYPSNWELSGARSGSIARLLEEFGIQSTRMEIIGYGSTRPKVSNDTAELRRLNRRIDILIKPDGY